MIPVRPIETIRARVRRDPHAEARWTCRRTSRRGSRRSATLLTDRAVYEARPNGRAGGNWVRFATRCGGLGAYLASRPCRCPLTPTAPISDAKRALLLQRLRAEPVAECASCWRTTRCTIPSHGGGDKSNRLLMEALAARGHRGPSRHARREFGDADHDKLLVGTRGARRGRRHVGPGAVRFACNGVDVRTLTRNPQTARRSSRGRSPSSIRTSSSPRPTIRDNCCSIWPCVRRARALSIWCARPSRCPSAPIASIRSVVEDRKCCGTPMAWSASASMSRIM